MADSNQNEQASIAEAVAEAIEEYEAPMHAGVPSPSFDLSSYFMPVGGNQYLPVAPRIAWFRDVNPSGEIHSQLVEHDLAGGYAMFRVRVVDRNGAIAEGHGSETMSGFKDYREKAETVAIGRALAHLGYGTLHALEIARMDGDNTKLADAPIERRHGNNQGNRPAQQRPQPKIENTIEGFSDDQILEALNFGKDRKVQEEQWARDADSAFLGDPQSEATKNRIRYIVTMANAAMRLAKDEEWRYIVLLQKCTNVAQFNAIIRNATGSGVEESFVREMLEPIRATRNF